MLERGRQRRKAATMYARRALVRDNEKRIPQTSLSAETAPTVLPRNRSFFCDVRWKTLLCRAREDFKGHGPERKLWSGIEGGSGREKTREVQNPEERKRKKTTLSLFFSFSPSREVENQMRRRGGGGRRSSVVLVVFVAAAFSSESGDFFSSFPLALSSFFSLFRSSLVLAIASRPQKLTETILPLSIPSF